MTLTIPSGSQLIVEVGDVVEANEEIIQNDFLAVLPTSSTMRLQTTSR